MSFLLNLKQREDEKEGERNRAGRVWRRQKRLLLILGTDVAGQIRHFRKLRSTQNGDQLGQGKRGVSWWMPSLTDSSGFLCCMVPWEQTIKGRIGLTWKYTQYLGGASGVTCWLDVVLHIYIAILYSRCPKSRWWTRKQGSHCCEHVPWCKSISKYCSSTGNPWVRRASLGG